MRASRVSSPVPSPSFPAFQHRHHGDTEGENGGSHVTCLCRVEGSLPASGPHGPPLVGDEGVKGGTETEREMALTMHFHPRCPSVPALFREMSCRPFSGYHSCRETTLSPRTGGCSSGRDFGPRVEVGLCLGASPAPTQSDHAAEAHPGPQNRPSPAPVSGQSVACAAPTGGCGVEEPPRPRGRAGGGRAMGGGQGTGRGGRAGVGPWGPGRGGRAVGTGRGDGPWGRRGKRRAVIKP